MTQLVILIVVMYGVVGSATWWSLKKRQFQKQQAVANTTRGVS